MQLRETFLAFLLLCAPCIGFSQVADQPSAAPAEPATTEVLPRSGTTTFVIKPLLLDAEDSSGAALALEYDFKFSRVWPFAGRTTQGSDTVDPKDADVTIREGELLLRARGTLASSKSKNPHSMLDFSASGFTGFSRPEAYYRLGLQATYETDQSFEDKQYSFGVVGAASKVSIIANGDAGSIIIGYASVHPVDDKTREGLVGNLDDFRRLNAEVSYSYPINHSKLRSLDLNYRLYQEVDAPSAIEQAGLDRHQLWLVRFNLAEGFFLQYSKGSLPFDQRDVRAVKVGWSVKLQ